MTEKVTTPPTPTALAKTGIEERLTANTQALRARFGAMSSRQRWGLFASLGALMAVGAAMIWLAFRPDMHVLMSGLEARDAQQVEQELMEANVPYDLTPDGATIRVPSASLSRARLAIAGKGLPSSGHLGFEIFDKPNWVGSEFDERVNYQRALEGELDHTIESLNAVEQARVNLVLPHDSLFTDDQRNAKASVVLKLRRTLNDAEAQSIRSLVAGAVDTLKASQVTLVDADGRQQFGPKTAGAEEAQYEQVLTGKLLETLTPVAGEDNVRASVTANFDSGSEDDIDEVYDPNKVATLSTDHAEASSGPNGQPAPGGVPGTASNTPNVKPPVYPQQTPPMENTKREQNTYAVSKSVRHRMQGPGQLRRVTAAILINDRMVTSADGKHVSWVPRTPAEMHEIQQLAQAAVGLDTSRGDQVTVQNLSFATNATATSSGLATRLIAHAVDGMGFVRYAVLFAVFVLVLIFIVRPVLGQLKQLTSSVQTLPAAHGPAPLLTSAGGLQLDQTDELSFERQQARAQVLFDRISDYVKKEPQQGTRLLQSWVRSAHKP
ncbi:MAG TPA: flagellar basal-body MS-ring/collar protein FliF [Acidobacteriaceae bacterium]|nr:flagellar basal-body MS-ring/collar protein FliF [Acidobacteriaceae bacterium]